MKLRLSVNGRSRSVDVDPETPLLWVLRDELGLVGTKFGCGIGSCGACTVHVDGKAVRSCTLVAEEAAGARIRTIEGLEQRGNLHPVQQVWLEEDVAQCGYCQTGQIMAVTALLETTPKPTDAEIDSALTNLCRCGSYPRIRTAIHRAAALLGGK